MIYTRIPHNPSYIRHEGRLKSINAAICMQHQVFAACHVFLVLKLVSGNFDFVKKMNW